MRKLKGEFPQLEIGVVGRKAEYTMRTRPLKAANFFSPTCIANGPYTLTQLDSMINSVGNYDDLQRSETIKFFLRTFQFSKDFYSDKISNCKSPINVFYLEDRYWNDASSATLSSVKAKFESYKSILRFLQARPVRQVQSA